MKFCSIEHLREVQARSNADEEYRRRAKGENDSYTLVLKSEPEMGIPEDIVVGAKIVDGEIAEVWEGPKPTDFTLIAPYGVWVDILIGKLNAAKAVSLRKLKVKGSFIKLLKSSSSTERWIEILRGIPTEFEGEYNKFNIKED